MQWHVYIVNTETAIRPHFNSDNINQVNVHSSSINAQRNQQNYTDGIAGKHRINIIKEIFNGKALIPNIKIHIFLSLTYTLRN